jgi:hypothetical protein
MTKSAAFTTQSRMIFMDLNIFNTPAAEVESGSAKEEEEEKTDADETESDGTDNEEGNETE